MKPCGFRLQLQNFEERVRELQSELDTQVERQRNTTRDLTAKEEEVVMLKVEMASITDQLNSRSDQVCCWLKEKS